MIRCSSEGRSVDSWLVRLPQDRVILGLSPDQGQGVVLFGRVLCSHCASLYPGAPGNLMLGETLLWTTCSIEGGIDISKSLHDTETRISSARIGHLSSYADSTLIFNAIQVTYSHTYFVFNSLKVPRLLKPLPLCCKPFLLASSCGRRLERLFKMQIKLQMTHSCHRAQTCVLLRVALQVLYTVRGCRVC